MTYRTLIIDAPYLFRRPFEATGKDPQKTIGAVGNAVLDLQDKFQPEVTYCCWEASGSVGRAFGWDRDDGQSYRSRRDICASYKAHREPWSPVLVDLVQEMIPILGQMGIVHVWCDDEADDAIAALVAKERGPHLIWSADKDLLQLVAPGVEMVRDYRGSDRTPITHETIVQRTGLTPAEWRIYLSLVGDQTDGIDGVPSIGELRARKIIRACPEVGDFLLCACDAFVAGQSYEAIHQSAMRAASTSAADSVRWIDHCFLHLKNFRDAYLLVQLRPGSPLHVHEEPKNQAAAAAWFASHDQEPVARRVAPLHLAWDDEEEEPADLGDLLGGDMP